MWLLDSKATFYIIVNQFLFFTYQVLEHSIIATINNDHFIVITKIESVQVTLQNKNDIMHLTLHNILYVSQMTKNLISSLKLLKIKVSLIVNSMFIWLVHNEQQTATKYLFDDLWMIWVNFVAQQAHLVTLLTSTFRSLHVWHQCLTHFDSNRIC